MDEETKELLAQLNTNIAQIGKGESVKQAAQVAPPKTDDPATGPEGADEIESKKITSKMLDEKFVDPLRKNFERLAKVSPSNFGYLGAKSVLDDPYSLIRAKKDDGSFLLKNAELDKIIKSILVINSDDPVANGAVTLKEWMAQSGNSEQVIGDKFEEAYQRKSFGAYSGEVRKALDSTTGAPLIRQDIDPILREAFNRVFPAYDMFAKIPANGIKHTWNQETSPGTATLIDELGDFSGSADNNDYAQLQSTNIAVAAAQREIGLKAMWASQQSGMNFNLGGRNNREVMGALTAIANVIQGQIFQGNETVAAKTLDDEDGLTNNKGFDGLRQQLKGAGTSINKGSSTYLQVLRSAVGQIIDGGGIQDEIAVFMSIGANNELDDELETFYQFMKSEAGQATPTNYSSAGLTMLRGILARIKPIPAGGAQGNGIGYYTFSAAATEDVYVMDPNGTSLPYIGSPTPSILELPTGWGNHLSNTYVPFLMIGMAIYVKSFNRKIRIAKTTI